MGRPEISFPEPRRLFTERHELQARFEQGDESFGPFDAVIDYSQLGDGGIRGFVLGTADVAHQLQELMNRSGWLTLKGETGDARVVAERTILRSTTVRRGGTSVGIVGEFNCQALHQETDLSFNAPSLTRTISFLLQGPADAWDFYLTETRSFDGTVSVGVSGGDLDLGIEPFQVSVGPHFFHERKGEYEGTTARSVTALTLTTSARRTDLVDAAVAEEAKRLADDICLLMSFLSRTRIGWYHYLFGTGDRYIEYRQVGTRTTKDVRLSHDDRMVPGRLDEYLRVALPVLRALRAEGDLFERGMRAIISSHDAPFIEGRFGGLFQGLESLKSYHAKRHGLEWSIPEGRFRTSMKVAKEQIRTSLAGEIHPSGALVTDLIDQKVPDLRRPAIWFVLEHLLKTYSVEWRDLYPHDFSESRPKFIRVRDRLFHGGEAVSTDELVSEWNRLRAIAERLILRMTGWTRAMNVPPAYFAPLVREGFGAIR